MKWGYFEVGAYIGSQDEREQVLHDFTLGRLDVGESNLSKALAAFLSQCSIVCYCSCHII